MIFDRKKMELRSYKYKLYVSVVICRVKNLFFLYLSSLFFKTSVTAAEYCCRPDVQDCDVAFSVSFPFYVFSVLCRLRVVSVFCASFRVCQG